MIGSAHAAVTGKKQNAERIQLGAEYALHRLSRKFPREEIEQEIDKLEAAGRITPEFCGLLVGILHTGNPHSN